MTLPLTTSRSCSPLPLLPLSWSPSPLVLCYFLPFPSSLAPPNVPIPLSPTLSSPCPLALCSHSSPSSSPPGPPLPCYKQGICASSQSGDSAGGVLASQHQQMPWCSLGRHMGTAWPHEHTCASSKRSLMQTPTQTQRNKDKVHFKHMPATHRSEDYPNPTSLTTVAKAHNYMAMIHWRSL